MLVLISLVDTGRVSQIDGLCFQSLVSVGRSVGLFHSRTAHGSNSPAAQLVPHAGGLDAMGVCSCAAVVGSCLSCVGSRIQFVAQNMKKKILLFFFFLFWHSWNGITFVVVGDGD